MTSCLPQMARWRPTPQHVGEGPMGTRSHYRGVSNMRGVRGKGTSGCERGRAGGAAGAGGAGGPRAADGAWTGPALTPAGAAKAAAALQAPEPRAWLPASRPPVRGTASPAPNARLSFHVRPRPGQKQGLAPRHGGASAWSVCGDPKP